MIADEDTGLRLNDEEDDEEEEDEDDEEDELDDDELELDGDEEEFVDLLAAAADEADLVADEPPVDELI